jgi:hypothetical protein
MQHFITLYDVAYESSKTFRTNLGFGRFVPDWDSGSVTMLTVMVNLP